MFFYKKKEVIYLEMLCLNLFINGMKPQMILPHLEAMAVLQEE